MGSDLEKINREIKQMLHFSTLIILAGLILINLIGLMQPLPSQLKGN